MFEHFDEAARRCVALTQEETRRLGHAEMGAEHLLLGIARVDEALVGAELERLRAAVVGLCGVGDDSGGEWLAFTPEAKAALEGANEQALSRGHTTIDPAHVLLAVLDADGVARRVLRETELIVADVRERAEAVAGRRRPPVTPGPGRSDHESALRAGDAVAVTLGQDPFPIGDLGHPRTDGELLRRMLARESAAGRLLRENGIDEAAIDAALGPRESG
ncbi:MAG TPA: Clp protease N-terminal domain-containing protein [Solirubrobacteraceae bacterium]|nr:Clp protease N-terminal domain-containing protein [Solirubrobacteraceae bacterium]